MTDRPIIFSAPMVRALLDGRKTQTRRLVKPQPVLNEAGLWRWPDLDQDTVRHLRRFGVAVQTDAEGIIGTLTQDPARCLRFAPGDRLWGRETFRFIEGTGSHNWDGARQYRADGAVKYGEWHTPEWWGPIDPKNLWRPSIHMPRWASRLTLIVTDVRAQRLQEISDADAWAEGVECRGSSRFQGEAIGLYATLWDSLHGAGAWDANPWVSATSFTVHHGNIDQMEAA